MERAGVRVGSPKHTMGSLQWPDYVPGQTVLPITTLTD